MSDLLLTLITSISVGSLYALIALGYTMVFGVLKLINFAHSDIVVLGVWISLTTASVLLPLAGVYVPEAPWWAILVVLMVSMLSCGLIGFCIERFAYKPIRKAPRLNALITAIGVSLLLQNVAQLQFNIVKSKTTTAISGKVASRADAKHLTLDQPLMLDTSSTYALRFADPAPPTIAATTAPAKIVYEERPLPLKPGTYAVGTTIALDRGLPARFASAAFDLQRTSMPIRFPFGASTASMPKGFLPESNADLTAEQKGRTTVFFPNRATIVHFNLYSDGELKSDGTRGRIYKPLRITVVDAIIVGTSLTLMAALQFLVFGTRLGTAMRAVSYNMDTSALMGIPVDRIVSITFVTGTMLAAAAGFLYSIKYPVMQQPANFSWTLLGLKAFIAAVVGGIGNLRGAAVGGFLIAFIEQFAAYGGNYFGYDWVSKMTDVVVFGLLIVVLLVKPSGLFGSTVREKV